MEEAPGYTGEVSHMKEAHGEDRVSHTDPESCTVVRKGGCEALTGACAGGLWSHEIIRIQGADVVSVGGRQYPTHRYGKRCGDPARLENLSMGFFARPPSCRAPHET